MTSINTATAVAALISTFFKYGVPFLLLSAGLSYISARLTTKKKRRAKAPFPTNSPFPELKPLADLEIKARRPLTQFEEKMFFVLTNALPECVVLAQVSFSSLIDTSSQADRNRFDRKTADFLICSKLLTPIAIIELDDRSHDVKAAQDNDRDAMLRNAGYNTIRYKKIPTAAEIQTDIENILKRLTLI